MKLSLIHIIAILSLFQSINLQAQSDTVINRLSFEDFMMKVQEGHPLALQADLEILKGEAAVQNARGGFDPKTYADLSQKYYEDKQYYSLLEGGLKVPTWFGIELMGGYSQNEGTYLNPENNVPSNGLYFAGVSVAVGQGLFIDQRRAALKTAKLYASSTKASRQYLLNQLYFEATYAYWNWFQAYYQLSVYEEALGLAEFRFAGVKRSAAVGDSPSIDTLEAGIQVQNRRLSLQQALLDYKNATAAINVFLWADGLIPLEIDENTYPAVLDDVIATNVDPKILLQLDSLVAQHPMLQMNRFEIEQLEVERRLKAEQLKPNLNLKYQPIVEGNGSEALDNFNQNNYQWGLEFAFPIFLRKERGALRQSKLKIQEKQFDLENKNEQIKFQVKAAINQWNTSKDQAILYRKTSQDYKALLAGERNLFEIGESSLFLVNRRELGYINAQIKMIELIAKNKIAQAKTFYQLGILGQ